MECGPVSMIPESIFYKRIVALYAGLFLPKGRRIKILGHIAL